MVFGSRSLREQTLTNSVFVVVLPSSVAPSSLLSVCQMDPSLSSSLLPTTFCLRLDAVRPLVAGRTTAAKLTSVFVLLLGDDIITGGGDVAAIFVLFGGSDLLPSDTYRSIVDLINAVFGQSGSVSRSEGFFMSDSATRWLSVSTCFLRSDWSAAGCHGDGHHGEK